MITPPQKSKNNTINAKSALFEVVIFSVPVINNEYSDKNHIDKDRDQSRVDEPAEELQNIIYSNSDHSLQSNKCDQKDHPESAANILFHRITSCFQKFYTVFFSGFRTQNKKY